jgi:hypothetical protein
MVKKIVTCESRGTPAGNKQEKGRDRSEVNRKMAGNKEGTSAEVREGYAPQSPGGGEVHEMKEQAAGRAEDGGRICMVSEGGAG